MSTSYDTTNTTALAFLAGHYRVPFSVADDIQREDCPRCDDEGAVTTVRVYGDTDDNTSCDLVECCVGCMDREIEDAVTKARVGGHVLVELASLTTATDAEKRTVCEVEQELAGMGPDDLRRLVSDHFANAEEIR